jgi:nucleoside-diphosphate-sugar epimerase
MLTHSHPVPRKPSRVVVLGASGFIAGAIRKRIEADAIPTLPLGRPGVDLLSPDATRHLIAALRPEDVLVFASAKAPCRDLPMLRDNLAMCEAVCAALKAQAIAQVVYISSDAVYKDLMQPLSEDSCAEPASYHGVMHLARELALRQESSGPLAIVRPTLVYGLDDPHNGYGPNRFRRLAAQGKDIVLFGEGEERRDHVDVEDIAEFVRLIILHRSQGIANAVSGEVVSFRELAEFTAAAFSPRVQVKGSPRSGPMPHNGYRPLSNQAAREAFPEFRFKGWREGLSAVHTRMQTSSRQ